MLTVVHTFRKQIHPTRPPPSRRAFLAGIRAAHVYIWLSKPNITCCILLTTNRQASRLRIAWRSAAAKWTATRLKGHDEFRRVPAWHNPIAECECEFKQATLFLCPRLPARPRRIDFVCTIILNNPDGMECVCVLFHFVFFSSRNTKQLSEPLVVTGCNLNVSSSEGAPHALAKS